MREFFVLFDSIGVTSALELDGATVALFTGTAQEIAIATFFRENNMIYEPVPVGSLPEMEQQFLAGAADVAIFPESFIQANGYDMSPYVTLPDFIFTDGTPETTTARDDLIDQSTATEALEINGQAGNDTLLSGSGADTLRGGVGLDALNGGAGPDLLFGGQDDDVIIGGRGFDLLRGGLGDDSLRGNRGNDDMAGGDGFDTLDGGAGNDTLAGGDRADLLLGGADHDVLVGNRGRDVLFGGQGRDALAGNLGDDVLAGGRGSDTLNGGAGNDTLTGGLGPDRFVLAGTFGQDSVTDFDPSQVGEVIDLTGLAGITDFADLGASHLRQDGANAVIRDGSGNTLSLVGIDVTALTADHFAFG